MLCLGDEEMISLKKISFNMPNGNRYRFDVEFYWSDLLDVDYIFKGSYSTAKIITHDSAGEPMSVIKLSGVTPLGPIASSFDFDYSKTDMLNLNVRFGFKEIEVTNANL